MKKILKIAIFLLCIFAGTNIFAEYSPFGNIKNARELIKRANHYQVHFRYRQARTILDFDKISDLHVYGRNVYATWFNTFRIGSYIGKPIDDVQRQFRNSNIKLKIIYVPTTNLDSYGRVYKQSIKPYSIVVANKFNSTVRKNSNIISKPNKSQKQIENVYLNGHIIGHYEYIYKRSSFGARRKMKVFVQGPNRNNNNSSYNTHNTQATPYDTSGNVLLTLYVYKYSGKATKMIDLKGLTLQEAKAKLKKLKIPIGYIQDIYAKTKDRSLYGKIFHQTIKAGTLITKPKYMGVKIYSMPKINMPNLARDGWTLKKAQHFPYFIVVPSYKKILSPKPTWNRRSTSLEGKIYKQDIKPGTILFRPTKVHVGVYNIITCIYPPFVVNQKTADAIAKIKSVGLKPVVTNIDLLDFIKKNLDVSRKDGVVVEQDFSCVVPGSKISIRQLKLKNTILPNWENKDCDSVKKEIEKIKTKLGEIYFSFQEVENKSYKKGNILIGSEPKWGSVIKTFDKVKLLCRKRIYLPKYNSSTEAIIPLDIKGKTEDEAKKELSALGFTNIKVKKQKKLGAVDGTVLDVLGQLDNPTIGIVRSKKEKMTLLIADINAKFMPLMPNILGATPEVAKRILIKKGFKDIRFESEASSFVKHITSLPAGVVIATSPRGGNICQYGFDSTIFLTVKLKLNQKLPKNVKQENSKKSDIVKVPPLDTTVEKTVKKIKDRGLVPKIVYIKTKFKHFDGKIKPGSNPSWNTIVKRGTTVTFSVYTFHAIVPTVVAISKQTAIKILHENGYKERVNYFITDNKNLDGDVKSQKPKAGTEAKQGTIVDILVYKYSNLITVPKVTNISKDRAIDIITKYTKGLEYKIIYTPTVLKTLDGTVYKTMPPYKTKVSVSSTITLYVYKLLDKVPSVIGKTEDSAISYLKQFGFDVIKLYSGKHKAGIVWFQHPAANSKVTHSAITISIGKSTIPKPSMRQSIKISQPSSDITLKIQNFYRRFKEAYESRDEGSVVSLLSSDWETSNGGDISDLEDNLNRVFRVFDEIEYNISNFSMQALGDNLYKVSYNVNIKGYIYDSDITHDEKSSVQEEVKIDNGKVLIVKTIGGQYWSIK